MALEKYNKKRKFKATPEPKGKVADLAERIFVVQEHHARNLHYDFRLEHGGVLLSWAVPKGISLDPKVKHFAKRVEDHPVDYADFSGEIPKGNYGAGIVKIWDRGKYSAGEEGEDQEKYIETGLHKKPRAHFVVTLQGKKLKGDFVLSQLKDDDWLIFKRKD